MMDTTEKYIKMCEKAEEIRKEWKPSLGDCVGSYSTNHGFDYCGVVSQHDGHIFAQKYSKHPFRSSIEMGVLSSMITIIDNGKPYIWLPRQDQLQEMVKGGIGAILDEFHDFVILDEHHKDFNSWEQLWLAFVMHEKYGKRWDDEKGEWNCPTNADISDTEKRA